MQTQTTTTKKGAKPAPAQTKKTEATTKKQGKSKILSKTTGASGETVTKLAPVPTKAERQAAAFARAEAKKKAREEAAKARIAKAEQKAAAVLKRAQEREAELSKAREQRQLDAAKSKLERQAETEAKRLHRIAEKAAAKLAAQKARTAPKFEVAFTTAEGVDSTESFRKAIEARSFMVGLMKQGLVFTVSPVSAPEAAAEPTPEQA